MTPRRNRSRKRSAASSTARRLEPPVVFLDESIYSRILAEELERAGVSVRKPGVDVPFGASDADWLTLAGSQRWIVLSRDQRVRHRASELEALRAARVGAIVVTAGQATARETTRIILSRLPKILNIARSESKPFLYTLRITGALSRVKVR